MSAVRLKSDWFARFLGLVKMNMVLFIWIFVCVIRLFVVRKALYVTMTYTISFPVKTSALSDFAVADEG